MSDMQIMLRYFVPPRVVCYSNNLEMSTFSFGLCPKVRDKGKIRTQFHHAIDIVPTILEAIGVEPPPQIGGYTQAPIEGVSMLYSFNDSKAPTKLGCSKTLSC
jgi:hypothetical protein